MYETIGINILAVLVAYLAKYKNFKFGLKISFLIIFLFLAFRFDFGNDYMAYYQDFLKLNSYTTFNYFNNSFHYEVGWLVLCRLFNPFGFFSLVFFLALFNCLVYYWFLKRYVPNKYYWIAVFFYVFTPDFMLLHASAMRQSIAIGIFLIAIPYILKKDFIRYYLCIGIASLFHTSALFLIPIFFIGVFNWDINKLWGIILYIVFLSLFIFGNILVPLTNNFMALYFKQYVTYLNAGTELNSGIGVIFLSIVFLFTLYYSKYQYKEIRILFTLVVISFMFIPLGLLISMAGRIGMYFAPATIVVYPLIILKIKNPLIKKGFSIFLILFTLYTFFAFFNSDVFRHGYMNYRTIFSDPAILN